MQVVCWVFAQEVIGNEMNIAEAEGLIGTAVPVGIGDAVADEENGLIRF